MGRDVRLAYSASQRTHDSQAESVVNCNARNQVRAKFDFVGTPIRFIQRLRTRRDKNADTEN
jgi:hypothetical protein